MPRVALAFFTVAALCGLSGMVWGAIMGMSGDHSLAPAHAHLNLLGWVTLALMGAFYAFAGEAAGRRLPWVNFALSAFGAVAMAPLLALLLRGGEDRIGPMMPIAEVPVILGMVAFIAAVVRTWACRASAQTTSTLRANSASTAT